MRELIGFAIWNTESASVLVALVAWIVGTVWLLHSAERTERGLWEIRKGRGAGAQKNPKVSPPPRRYV